jgi:hypothetical protein
MKGVLCLTIMLAFVVILAFIPAPLSSGQDPATQPDSVQTQDDLERWPREIKVDETTFTVHQPQLTQLRTAYGLRPPQSKAPGMLQIPLPRRYTQFHLIHRFICFGPKNARQAKYSIS